MGRREIGGGAERTSIKPRHGDGGETALKWILRYVYINLSVIIVWQEIACVWIEESILWRGIAKRGTELKIGKWFYYEIIY